MGDLKQLDSIDFRVQQHRHRDLRRMRPELWVSLAIALVSSILAILQVYETIDLRSRLKSTEMQVKLAEANAADLATKNRMLSEGLTQANALIENLQNRPQAPASLPHEKVVLAERREVVHTESAVFGYKPCSPQQSMERFPCAVIRGGGGGQPGCESTPGITAGPLLVPVLRPFGHDPPDAASWIWNIALATGNDVNVSVD